MGWPRGSKASANGRGARRIGWRRTICWTRRSAMNKIYGRNSREGLTGKVILVLTEKVTTMIEGVLVSAILVVVIRD